MLTIICVLIISSAFAQQGDGNDMPSNSFANIYHKAKPTLMYSYNEKTQTHNYSYNWDFDNDGIKDELYFVGTAGAHLYYFLKVVLSTDKITRSFSFVETDFPLLHATDTSTTTNNFQGFIITNHDKNQCTAIIVMLDHASYSVNKKELLKNGIHSKKIAIRFEKGKTKYYNL